jgi:hypothetical protein
MARQDTQQPGDFQTLKCDPAGFAWIWLDLVGFFQIHWGFERFTIYDLRVARDKVGNGRMEHGVQAGTSVSGSWYGIWFYLVLPVRFPAGPAAGQRWLE